MKKITINKALKLKNRLAGEVASLQNQVREENSRRVDQKTKPDVGAIMSNLNDKTETLMALKGSINRASAPIADLLVGIAESKGILSFYKTLPTREGIEKSSNYGSNPVEVEYEAYMTKVDIQKAQDQIQQKINDTQDEIDEYNAQTFLDKEF
jgi:hypothetical protein